MAITCPSETREGQLWLGNFAPEDVAYAEMLLNSLHLVSENAFRAGLLSLISNVILGIAADVPIALYPVRAPSRDAAYVEPAPERPWAADDGSEHIVANIITELVRMFSSRRDISALDTLDSLRSRKARRVIAVDDYLGSGTSVTRYLDRWWANPSIKSWRSLGLVKFSIVAFACSSYAGRFLRHRLLDDVHWVEYGVDFSSAQWSDQERDNIRRICLKYATNRSLALGFRGSEGPIGNESYRAK